MSGLGLHVQWRADLLRGQAVHRDGVGRRQIKDSGYGRELGNISMHEFVNKKLVRSGHIAAPV